MTTQAVAAHALSKSPPCSMEFNVLRTAATSHPFSYHRKRSDEALIKLSAEGDKQAFQALFERHNTQVFRFVMRFVHDESLAEDLVSDVFFDAWRRAGQFEVRSTVPTWLLAIARHKAIAILRRRTDVQLDDEVGAGIEEPSDNPEADLEKKGRRTNLRKCLSQLSPAHREVIDLVYYHEKSVSEVAQIIGAPASTVKTRMFYARNQLKALLAKAGIDRQELERAQ